MFQGSAQKQSTDAPIATKLKSRVDDSCLLQSLYSCAVAETVKTGVSSITQKK